MTNEIQLQTFFCLLFIPYRIFPVLIADSLETWNSKTYSLSYIMHAALHQIIIFTQRLKGHLNDTWVQEMVRLQCSSVCRMN